VPREGKRAARAARELEAVSRLRHERCVRALDYGEDPGHVYLVYEVVHGSTLRERLRSGGLDERDSVEAAAQVLDALAHAHRRGIVHRDVKPSNVVVADGPTVAVKLLDFGLAQFDDADTLTAVGDVPGTLAYIAPERLAGEEASARSDVWAVGVMLWESLAGEHPFWGLPLPEVAPAIGRGAPPLAAWRADLPRALATAVDAALHVAPERRPTAAHLAHDLRAAFGPERARRETRPRGPRPALRPRPAPATAPAAPLEARVAPAVLAALVAAGGASLLPFWPPGLVAVLALAAGLAAYRAPRFGLALALAAPVFPLGNVAQGAALAYTLVAAAWLVATWRDARAGLAFCAGPLLAPFGLLGLLPLAVQPARGLWRKGLHAFGGVLAAALAAGLRDRGLPPTGADVGNLGLDGTERPGDAVRAIVDVLDANPAVLTTGIALALAAMALPFALRRGLPAIAALGLGQVVLVLAWAPTAPWPGIGLSTLLAVGLLGARPALALARRNGT
jgi:hypothetical protein